MDLDEGCLSHRLCLETINSVQKQRYRPRGEKRLKRDTPVNRQPAERIERENGAQIDKRPLLAANIFLIAEEIDGGKQRIQRKEGQHISMCPARQRLVQ